MADINLDAIEAEISKLTPEEIRAQLTAIKTKQKVTQKKYYNPENAKKLRLKKQAEINALVEKAKSMGIYDEVLAEANAAADAKLAEEEAENDTENGKAA